MGRNGQLGLGKDIVSSKKPMLVNKLKEMDVTVKSITCGLAHTIYLHDDGKISSCGMNGFGQLGIGGYESGFTGIDDKLMIDNKDAYTPCIVTLPKGCKITHIACGGAHSMIINDKGELYTCGSNSCGQLGMGNNSDSSKFVKVNDFGEDNCAFAACGEEFSATVTQNHTVFVWGLGIAGQIGNGQLKSNNLPVLVETLNDKGIVELSCSQGQVFAVSNTGEIYTWGLPGDKSHLLNLAQIPVSFSGMSVDSISTLQSGESFIIPFPLKVTNFSRKKKVLQISCGRKHYVMRIARPFGPFCYIQKGFGMEDIEKEDYTLEFSAGERIKFVIQAVDESGLACSSGGCQFTAELIPSSLEFDIHLKRQYKAIQRNMKEKCEIVQKPTSQTQKESALSVEIDDNFDGTYSGVCKILICGTYHCSIKLDELEIKSFPLELNITESIVSPATSVAWWGKYAVTNGGIKEYGEKGGFGSFIAAEAGASVVFTISTKDCYGNKCSKTDGVSVSVNLIAISTVADTNADNESYNESRLESTVKNMSSQKMLELNGAEILTSSIWSDSQAGIFPCVVEVPVMETIRSDVNYFVSVEMKGKINKKFGESVDGSPFPITISAKKEQVIDEKHERAENTPEENEETRSKVQNEAVDKNEEKKSSAEKIENVQVKVDNIMITARRAEMALKRHKGQCLSLILLLLLSYYSYYIMQINVVFIISETYG